MSGSSHVDVVLAGAAAAFTVDLMIYPLDTLKTRQQSRDFVRTFADPSAPTQLPSRQLFRGLYQGIGIVIVATLPAAGTFFTTYEAAKSFVGRHAGSSATTTTTTTTTTAARLFGPGFALPQPLVHSAASAIAECASCFVLTPAEVVKQNAQMIAAKQSKPPPSSAATTAPGGGGSSANKPAASPRPPPPPPSSVVVTRSSSLQALRQLTADGPLPATRRLLSGYSALVARNLPFTAIQFPIFEHLRERIWERRLAGRRGAALPATRGQEEGKGRQQQTLAETGVITGVSAGLAGSGAALITTPMDVVKTRMMLSAKENGGGNGNGNGSGSGNGNRGGGRGRHSRGSLSVARDVIAERGVPGLFRGAGLRAVWTAVGSGLYLGMYEVARVWLTAGREGGGSSSSSSSTGAAAAEGRQGFGRREESPSFP